MKCLVTVDGAWSVWQEWTICSKLCGGGIQTRTRACDNPKPQYDGAHCSDVGDEQRDCNTHSCASM